MADAKPLLPQSRRLAPDLSWILPQLAVGGRLPEDLVEHLAEDLGVRRVVDMRAEENDDAELLRRHGITFLHLPTVDQEPVEPPMLWQGVEWVREGLASGEKVLIHCEYGIGRSVLLTGCVLAALGRSPCDALELMKRARRQVSPSPAQLRAFLDWTAEWHDACGTACPPATWDELAAIAYRHLHE